MNRVRVAGVAVTTLAVVGYVVGVLAPYPGRAVTLTGVMVGLALWAAGG
jgi:hypothetical protein